MWSGSSCNNCDGKRCTVCRYKWLEVRDYPDFIIINDTICTVEKLQDPIEKLRQIVMDKEDYDYRTITLT